uniref:Uncharacterized protein n=1 Tax=Chromera velia CCMP2878 TaxID=1169474 RepID=A0A0G4HEE3_9ALVE|eukprot:Cvel_6547.t1-p1 / transcript=Cvel_6547.t1 / gene=Cvel_6547 / organism=Chromera_velia_CCMP2878 / gene_product=hypothetical protein / transcript_product=hypothetical protein / location=Cvel_scaffold322:49940-50758(-) / protein_length=273 / sequence_SO=supercontig / SO=protein_coding / is_pseudo=false
MSVPPTWRWAKKAVYLSVTQEWYVELLKFHATPYLVKYINEQVLFLNHNRQEATGTPPARAVLSPFVITGWKLGGERVGLNKTRIADGIVFKVVRNCVEGNSMAALETHLCRAVDAVFAEIAVYHAELKTNKFSIPRDPIPTMRSNQSLPPVLPVAAAPVLPVAAAAPTDLSGTVNLDDLDEVLGDGGGSQVQTEARSGEGSGSGEGEREEGERVEEEQTESGRVSENRSRERSSATPVVASKRQRVEGTEGDTRGDGEAAEGAEGPLFGPED